MDRNREQVGEVALGEFGPDVGAVACLLEQVRVGVERHARAGVSEDPADLNDVEADVDDQMTGEGVAEIVEAHPPAVDIESGIDGGAAEHPLGDIVVEERRTVGGRKEVVGAACESGVALVLAED